MGGAWRGTPRVGAADGPDQMADSLYDALLRLLARLPEVDKPIEVPGVWAGKIEPSRSSLVATLLTLRGTRPLSDFVEPSRSWMPGPARGLRPLPVPSAR